MGRAMNPTRACAIARRQAHDIVKKARQMDEALKGLVSIAAGTKPAAALADGAPADGASETTAAEPGDPTKLGSPRSAAQPEEAAEEPATPPAPSAMSAPLASVTGTWKARQALIVRQGIAKDSARLGVIDCGTKLEVRLRLLSSPPLVHIIPPAAAVCLHEESQTEIQCAVSNRDSTSTYS